MEKFEKILKDTHHHLTLPRRQVFSLLENSHVPMGVREIISELHTIDRSTVYRTVELFTILEIVKEVWFNNYIRYGLSDEFKGHYHHIVCERCGLITEVSSTDLEKAIDKLADRAKYDHLKHSVEIIGLCSSHR